MEVIKTYYLFSGSFDETAKTRLYTALDEIPSLELSKSPATIESWFAEERDVATPFKYKSDTPWIDFTPDAEALSDLAYFTLSFDPLAFDTQLYGEDGVKQNIEQTIDLIGHVYELATEIQEPPQYVIGANETDTERIEVNRQVRLTEEGIRSGQLENLFWLQIWSPDFVDTIGQDRIESAPGSRLEWLDNGSAFFVAYDDPIYGTGYLDLLDHFGLERP